MVNREICLHCWLHNRPLKVFKSVCVSGRNHIAVEITEKDELIEQFNKRWNQGILPCSIFFTIKDNPPLSCNFQLEHIVNLP